MSICFGNRVREQRERLGWSMAKLGEKAGVSSGYVSDIEHGKVSPSLEKATVIASTLNITVGWLLNEKPYVKSNETINAEIDNINSSDFMYNMFLARNKFPNGMTYVEMCEELKEKKEIEAMLNKFKKMFIKDSKDGEEE